MSWEVEHAYWHHWQPGKRVDHIWSAENQRELDSYVKKASRYNSTHRLLLLALAMDSNPILDVWGGSEMALAYTSIETLCERLHRSRRAVQYLLRELDYWGEIDLRACNGQCAQVRYAHHGTNHYYLPLPDGAQPWGRREKRHGRANNGRRKNGPAKAESEEF